jgi:Dolichyl-phosphate-mannose-protein mannosyltransferase
LLSSTSWVYRPSGAHDFWKKWSAVDIFLGFALLLFLSTQLQLLNLPYVESDEAAFAACAVRQLAFTVLPLTQCVDIKPPGIFAVYELIYSLFGNYSDFGLRLTGLLVVFGCAGALYRVARLTTDLAVAKTAAAIFLIICATSPFFFALKTELIAVAFYQLALSFLVVFTKNQRIINLLAAGCLLGIAALFKQPIILLGGAFSLSLYFSSKNNTIFQVWLKQSFLLGISCAGTVLSIMLIYIFTDNAQTFFEQFWLRPKLYAHHVTELNTAWYNLSLVPKYLYFTWMTILGLFAFIIFDLFIRKDYNFWKIVHKASWWLLPNAIAVCIAISLGKRFFPSYFMFSVPLISIFLAIILAPALKAVASSRRHVLFAIPFCFITLIMLNIQTVNFKRTLEGGLTNADPVLIHSQPGDKLYVWGYMPEFYVSSKMLPASRFVITSLLVGHFFEEGDNRPPERQLKFVRPGDWDLFMQDLTQAKAFMFVDANNVRMGVPGTFAPQRYPRMKQFMDRNCTFKTNIGPLPLYRCVVKPSFGLDRTGAAT